MIRKIMLVFTIVGLLILATPASAVTFGQPDNGQHPYVGLAVFYAHGAPQWRCSGTLMTPTVFLTAGHCTSDGGATPIDSAQVWFDEHVTTASGYPNSGGVTGTPIPHPNWTGGLTVPNTHDVGVVILNTAVTDKGFGKLAPAGYLDGLATQRGQQDVSFTVVGYGLQEVKPRFSALRDRLKATVKLVNLTSLLTDGYNIQTSNDPGKAHRGGTCFGDSGGPVFAGGFESNLVVGVNSFVLNENCKGAAFAHRTDIADTLNFLAQFGVTP